MPKNLNVSYSDYARATGMTEMNARYMLEALQTQLTNSERIADAQERIAREMQKSSGVASHHTTVVHSQFEQQRNAILDGVVADQNATISILEQQINEYKLIQAARDSSNKIEINKLKLKQKRIIAGREFERQESCVLFAKYSYHAKAKFYRGIKTRIEELTNVSMIAYNHLNSDDSAIKYVEEQIKNLSRFTTVDQVVKTGWIWKTIKIVTSRIENPIYDAELACLKDKLEVLRKNNNLEEQKLLMMIDPIISLQFNNPISFKMCSMAERVQMDSIAAYGPVPDNAQHMQDVADVEEFENKFNVVEHSQIEFLAIQAVKRKIAGQSWVKPVTMYVVS